MPIKKKEDSINNARLAATPETISDIASQANLGPIDEKTALMVRLCESKEENKRIQACAILNTKINTLEEKYKAVLRELRDKLRAIVFDDFLKIIIGVLGGIVARSVSQQGIITAMGDPVVVYGSLFFIICIIFLVIRSLWPSKRKQEIKTELKKFEDAS